jgi:hypothetical protein
VAEVTGEAAAPCMLAAAECIWVEAECMSAGVPRCVSAVVDAAFGTAVGTPTESAHAGSSPQAATSGFAAKDCSGRQRNNQAGSEGFEARPPAPLRLKALDLVSDGLGNSPSDPCAVN